MDQKPNDDLSEQIQPLKDNPKQEEPIILYSQRWWIVSAVSTTLFAIQGQRTAYCSVTKSTAKFYDQTGDNMDFIILLSVLFSIPFCLVALYVIDRFGLRIAVNSSSCLAGFGKILQGLFVTRKSLR